MDPSLFPSWKYKDDKLNEWSCGSLFLSLPQKKKNVKKEWNFYKKILNFLVENFILQLYAKESFFFCLKILTDLLLISDYPSLLWWSSQILFILWISIKVELLVILPYFFIIRIYFSFSVDLHLVRIKLKLCIFKWVLFRLIFLSVCCQIWFSVALLF